LAEIERVAVIGDVHADWRVLSAVAEQIAAAGGDLALSAGWLRTPRSLSPPDPYLSTLLTNNLSVSSVDICQPLVLSTPSANKRSDRSPIASATLKMPSPPPAVTSTCSSATPSYSRATRSPPSPELPG
jgi:hypothetical protein